MANSTMLTIILIGTLIGSIRANGAQWPTNGNGNGNGNGNRQSNGWQKNSASGPAGSAQSQHSSNAYDNGDKYGYDYTIPGAKVHFAASRGAGAGDGASTAAGAATGAGARGNGGGGGVGGGSGGASNGWNDFARKQWSAGGNTQHAANNGRQRNNFASRPNQFGGGGGWSNAASKQAGW